MIVFNLIMVPAAVPVFYAPSFIRALLHIPTLILNHLMENVLTALILMIVDRDYSALRIVFCRKPKALSDSESNSGSNPIDQIPSRVSTSQLHTSTEAAATSSNSAKTIPIEEEDESIMERSYDSHFD
jgi:hypothetical protein